MKQILQKASRGLFLFGLTASIFSLVALGQTFMFGRADFPAGGSPTAAILADVNGDGISDIVVANFADNTVSVLLGKTDGTFGAKLSFPTGQGPVSVVARDFNNDGKLDLAVANASDSSVSVLLGNGDGSFQAPVNYATKNPPRRVIAGDFNGDGKLDVVTVNSTFVTGSNNNSVSIFLGKGDGTFAASKDTPIDGATVSITPGDFNGDGKLDLAVANVGLQVIQVLMGNGDGTFQAPVNYGAGNGSFVTSDIIAADLNRDGFVDLASCGGGNVSVLYGNGDGTFQPRVDYPAGSDNAGSITAGDFVGDGALGLAVANGFRGGPPVTTVTILSPNGSGGYGPAVDFNTGAQPLSVAAGDLNGDGRADLVMATDNNSVTELIATGLGTFQKSADYQGGAVPMSVVAGDFNGDGKMDVATSNRVDNTVSVFLGKGDGTFQPSSAYAVGPAPRGMATADVNGDGKQDLIVANANCKLIFPPCTSTGSVSVLLAGAQAFQATVTYPVNGNPVSVAVGDFNRDGRVDIVVANANSPGTVSVLLGNGDGTFQTPKDYATAAIPMSITVGDFNGDGKLDIAVACAPNGGNAGVVSLLLGQGDGTFQSHMDYGAPGGPIAIVSADFNQDGKLDVAVAGNGDNNVSILLGKGDGTFQSQASYSAGHQLLGALAIGDFNGDGIKDLAVTNDSDNTVTLLLGKGDGTFPRMVDYEYSTEGTSFGITSADFSGDGGSDLAVANFGGGGGNSVSILLNLPVAAMFPSGKLAFAIQNVGSTSNPQTIKLSNPSGTGLETISILQTDSTGSPVPLPPLQSDFVESDNCVPKIAAGSNCDISVEFAPTQPLTRSGQIFITTNAVNAVLPISLSGTGYGPAITLAPSFYLYLGNQPMNTVGSAMPVTLTSSGNAPLSISSIGISGTYAGEFSQTNTCPVGGAPLAPNAMCTVNVVFAPTINDLETANLTIADNVPGSSQTLSLYGTGTDFFIERATPDHCFANCSTSATVKAGQTATFNLQVSLLPAGEFRGLIGLLVGFSGTVQLNCSGAPMGSVCSVSPNPVTVNPANVPPGGLLEGVPFTVTVSTTARSFVTRPSLWSDSRKVPVTYEGPILLLLLATILVAHFGRGVRIGRSGMMLLAVLVFLCLNSCGGGSVSNNSSAPTSATLTITGTSGGLTHSTTLHLQINP